MLRRGFPSICLLLGHVNTRHGNYKIRHRNNSGIPKHDKNPYTIRRREDSTGQVIA